MYKKKNIIKRYDRNFNYQGLTFIVFILVDTSFILKYKMGEEGNFTLHKLFKKSIKSFNLVYMILNVFS